MDKRINTGIFKSRSGRNIRVMEMWKSGLNQYQVATVCGISQSTVHRIVTKELSKPDLNRYWRKTNA